MLVDKEWSDPNQIYWNAIENIKDALFVTLPELENEVLGVERIRMSKKQARLEVHTYAIHEGCVVNANILKHLRLPCERLGGNITFSPSCYLG